MSTSRVPASVPPHPAPQPAGPQPLSARLREATRPAHRAAEQAGAMGALLRGRLEAARYARLLRALHAVYAALESALARHAAHPAIAPLDAAPLARAHAAARDLDALRAEGIVDPIAGLPRAALDYVARLRALEAGAPHLLAAHAYVRYLGDLSGGQVLAPIVERAYRLAPGAATRLYDFGPREAVARRAQALRAALDALPLGDEGLEAIVAEAIDAFGRHVRLFEEIEAGDRAGA
jgi:heme oxygenase